MRKSNFWTRGRKVIGGLVIAGVILVMVILFVFIKSATFQRWWKSLGSNVSGGINRVVYVYDDNGHLLRTYEGYIDIKDTDYGNKVLFDLNGNRIVIYNCNVIVEEVD